jgi:excisionase family DNA binding protein
MEAQPGDQLLGSQDLADYLGVPLRTVYVWAARGTGPERVRVGRHTRYRMSAVNAWLDAKVKRSRQSA